MIGDNNSELLFKPSWIDRFNNWVGRLPIQEWIFYTLFGFVLILVQALFIWVEGNLYLKELLPLIIFNSLAIPYLLALIHLLDTQALSALKSMRPVLELSEEELSDFVHRLSNMPFLAPLAAGLVVMVLTILTGQVAIEPTRYALLEQTPIFTIVYQIIDKCSAFLVGVFIYHTIRQLRIVNSINMNHVRINLYHLDPVRAFSGLTASTAIGLLFFVYPWMLINPELFQDPLIIAIILMFTLLAVAVFVWPLYGVHRRMEKEKRKAMHEINLCSEGAFSKFNELIQDGDYSSAEKLHGVISSLDIQQRRINDIPTWPWKTETARIVLTAIALPLVLMIIQYFVLQALER